MGPANYFVLDTCSNFTVKLKKEHLTIKQSIIWLHNISFQSKVVSQCLQQYLD